MLARDQHADEDQLAGERALAHARDRGVVGAPPPTTRIRSKFRSTQR
jgi:hypothetical protein